MTSTITRPTFVTVPGTTIVTMFAAPTETRSGIVGFRLADDAQPINRYFTAEQTDRYARVFRALSEVISDHRADGTLPKFGTTWGAGALLDEAASRVDGKPRLDWHAAPAAVRTRPHHDWFNAPGRPETNMAPAVPSTSEAPIYRNQTSDLVGVKRAPEVTIDSFERTEAPKARVVTFYDVTQAVKASLPDIPRARYAVKNDAGEWRFYRVDRPQTGAHKGRVFVKVQASDDLHNMRPADALAAVKKIAADVKEAAVAYGREIGRCSVCNRTLTRATSIERAMGDKCASGFGF